MCATVVSGTEISKNVIDPVCGNPLYAYRFGNDNRERIVHFKDHWKNKVLELIQACQDYLDKDDLLRRKVDDALKQMSLL